MGCKYALLGCQLVESAVVPCLHHVISISTYLPLHPIPKLFFVYCSLQGTSATLTCSVSQVREHRSPTGPNQSASPQQPRSGRYDATSFYSPLRVCLRCLGFGKRSLSPRACISHNAPASCCCCLSGTRGWCARPHTCGPRFSHTDIVRLTNDFLGISYSMCLDHIIHTQQLHSRSRTSLSVHKSLSLLPTGEVKYNGYSTGRLVGSWAMGSGRRSRQLHWHRWLEEKITQQERGDCGEFISVGFYVFSTCDIIDIYWYILYTGCHFVTFVTSKDHNIILGVSCISHRI